MKNQPKVIELKNYFKYYVNRKQDDITKKIGPYCLKDCTFFQFVEYHNRNKNTPLKVDSVKNLFKDIFYKRNNVKLNTIQFNKD